jgi:triacylglycerol lipase
LGLIFGPAGAQLGPVDFDLGVLAGTRTLDPITSLALPNPDDG